MAAKMAVVQKGKAGKWNVTFPVEVVTTKDHENGVTAGTTFRGVMEAKDAEEAFNWQAAYFAAQESAAGAEIRAALTYRNELSIIGPSGFAVITGTQDTYEWLGRNFQAIIATFEANKTKVAADYSKRPKALPKGETRPEKSPIAIVSAKA